MNIPERAQTSTENDACVSPAGVSCHPKKGEQLCLNAVLCFCFFFFLFLLLDNGTRVWTFKGSTAVFLFFTEFGCGYCVRANNLRFSSRRVSSYIPKICACFLVLLRSERPLAKYMRSALELYSRNRSLDVSPIVAVHFLNFRIFQLK